MPRPKKNPRSEQLKQARDCRSYFKALRQVPVSDPIVESPRLDEPSTSSVSQQPASRSAEKFMRHQALPATDVGDASRALVDIVQIQALISQLSCPECFSVNTLSLHQAKQQGMAVEFSTFCRSCDSYVGKPVFSSERDESSSSKPKPFMVNKSAALASILVGLGPYQFNQLCGHLELPGIHQKTFNKFATQFYTHNENLAHTVFQESAKCVVDAYAQLGIYATDGILDISVSFDGSWLTRGHKSLVGIGCVIDIITGLVVDCHVSSLHCQTCATTGARKKRITPHLYDAWLKEHQASGCSINFAGSSGMMEVEAAGVLWARSVERFRLRYTTFVGDGDSKAYNRVCEIQPYGPDVSITKEECLNHVGKRMGTALRNLVTDCSKRGVTLGGKGHGRLTANAIRKLSMYYTRAIRGHSTAEEMRKAIWASIYHGYSTDDLPQHMYCPLGHDSWCFYKKSLACNLFPSGHRKRVHTPLDYDLLHQYLQPVYERLTADSLLRRCEKKATQNANESFHHSVWARCSKSKFHSKEKVEMAVISAAADFNFGPSYSHQLKVVLGVKSGQQSQRINKSRVQKRLYKSQGTQQAAEKKRKTLRAEAREKARREAEEEYGVAYAPGMF